MPRDISLPPAAAGDNSPLQIDILIEAGDWPDERDLHALVRNTLGAAVAELDLAAAGQAEISLVFTDDAHIRGLNSAWREKDKATNVLSFPAMPARPGAAWPPVLGDIVLAAETVRREAALEGKPFEHHVSHLVAHGFLHILGYDHESDAEAEEMEALERLILARLAIPDPYR